MLRNVKTLARTPARYWKKGKKVGFRKLKGVNLPEVMQGYIRFTCLTYKTQPAEIREKVDRLCKEAGGEYSRALKDVMCTRKSVKMIAYEYHSSENTLYRLRKKFYESWRSP